MVGGVEVHVRNLKHSTCLILSSLLYFISSKVLVFFCFDFLSVFSVIPMLETDLYCGVIVTF